MRKAFTGLLALLFVFNYSYAQSKVFREVSSEIASQVKAIRQDNAVVGYLVFTKLEKISEDSFNYRITVMDENLNDIGVINFRERNLTLHDVSFEKDILCLAYLRENIIGKKFKNSKAFVEAAKKDPISILIQFLGLNGKLLNSKSIPIDFDRWFHDSNTGITSDLKQDIQLRNIPEFGFACTYGEKKVLNLQVYKVNGGLAWSKEIKDAMEFSALLTSKQGIYLLIKKRDPIREGGFEMFSYGVQDSVVYPKYVLKDKNGNYLKVLSFDNDPVTGNPYVSGNIIDSTKSGWIGGAYNLFKGPYIGVFTINFNGFNKNDIQAACSYWNDGSQSFVNAKGYYNEQKAFVKLTHAFKDYQGNTYFAGSSVHRKPTFPLFLLFLPPYKIKAGDPYLVKQNIKGGLAFDSNVPTSATKPSSKSISVLDIKPFYPLSNPGTQTNYLIVDDRKNISIYNVNTKKVSRTIPSKEGSISYYIFPAKEGHFMIAEYNKKEKYTRVSIEAL